MAVSGSTRPLDNLPDRSRTLALSGLAVRQKDMVCRLFEPKVVDLIGGLTNWQLRIKEGN